MNDHNTVWCGLSRCCVHNRVWASKRHLPTLFGDKMVIRRSIQFLGAKPIGQGKMEWANQVYRATLSISAPDNDWVRRSRNGVATAPQVEGRKQDAHPTLMTLPQCSFFQEAFYRGWPPFLGALSPFLSMSLPWHTAPTLTFLGHFLCVQNFQLMTRPEVATQFTNSASLCCAHTLSMHCVKRWVQGPHQLPAPTAEPGLHRWVGTTTQSCLHLCFSHQLHEPTNLDSEAHNREILAWGHKESQPQGLSWGPPAGLVALLPVWTQCHCQDIMGGVSPSDLGPAALVS